MPNLSPTVRPVPANPNFFRVSLHVSNRALLAEVKQLVLEREAIALSDTAAVQRALSEMRTKLLRAKKGK